MRFKIFGTEIYVSFLFAAIITVMLAVDRTGLVIPSMFAVFMHELGHLFAMWVLESSPKQIRLIPASVQVVRKADSFRRSGESAVALSGPAVNIILFVSLYINYVSFKNETSLCYALLNLVIGLFNLIPVMGLDGGTVLFNILCKRKSVEKAVFIMRAITVVTAITVVSAGVILALRHKFNISVFIIGVYLFVMSLIKM